MTSEITVNIEHLNLTEITNGLKVTGDMEATTITTSTITAPNGNVNVRSNGSGLYFSLGTNNGELPFQLRAGSSGSNRHMRIGTDVGHDGDAAMEIFQNSNNSNVVDPGWIEVNGDLHAKKGLHLSGELNAQGNVRTNNKLYFGGEDKSSYIMHIDGYIDANGSKIFYIDCKSNAFLNVKVSVGGRAAWHQGGEESNIYGYMYPSGYLYERQIFEDSPVAITAEWHGTSQLKVIINNSTGDGGLMFAGTVIVSQHGYGF